jgi:hypothetical protein
MKCDEYVRSVLARYDLPSGPDSPAEKAVAALDAPIKSWAGRYLLGVEPTGSYAKNTRILGGTDIDILVSLGPRTPMDAPKLYDHFFAWLKRNGFSPKRQSVSIRLQHHGVSVDLIPARQEWGSANDHQLFATERRRALRTNFATHVKYVLASDRMSEIRAVKVWRQRRGLHFPSFYLELAVIDALRHRPTDLLSGNIELALKYLRDVFPGVPFRDPANPENRVSDTLLEHEKLAIADAAKESLLLDDWRGIIS